VAYCGKKKKRLTINRCGSVSGDEAATVMGRGKEKRRFGSVSGG